MSSTPETDDDDDMFIMKGGAASAVSIYTGFNNELKGDDGDDDDEDDDLLEARPRHRRRRRKSGGTVAMTSEAEDRETPSSSTAVDKDEATRPATSVFDSISADEENCDADAYRDNCVTEVDLMQRQAAISIANARRLLSTEANEEGIERDAELFARQEAERARRLDEIRPRATDTRDMPRPVPAVTPVNRQQPASSCSEGEAIVLRVRCADQSVKMKIRTTDPLLKMLRPFCTRFGFDVRRAVMEVDGEEIVEGDTPSTYDLEENSIVDVRLRKR